MVPEGLSREGARWGGGAGPAPSAPRTERLACTAERLPWEVTPQGGEGTQMRLA